MAKTRKMWVYSPPKPAKPKVSESVKTCSEGNELVETVIKPRHIKPPPKKPTSIVGTSIPWYRPYFYFCAKHAVPA
jgi:hypothetical protein